MLSIFSCASWSSVCLLWKNIYLLLLPIFDWVVCPSDIEMYELFVYFGNNPMLVTSFANIFSHSVCCLLVLFMISLLCKKKKKKLLRLIGPHLFIFAFISFTLGDPKTIAVIYVSVLPLFSSKSFRESLHSFCPHSHPMASAFTFSSA